MSINKEIILPPTTYISIRQFEQIIKTVFMREWLYLPGTIIMTLYILYAGKRPFRTRTVFTATHSARVDEDTTIIVFVFLRQFGRAAVMVLDQRLPHARPTIRYFIF